MSEEIETNGKEEKKKPQTFRDQCEDLGIEFVKTPEQQAHAGLFEPPPGFPKDRYAIEWVSEDQVRFKEQKTTMVGVGAVAPGLTTWKGEDGKGKPEKRHTTGNKCFVLMVRPKELQMAMNALYGNVSKRYYNNALTGKAIGLDPNGNEIPMQDPGMLSADRLHENIDESLMSLNRIPKRVEEAAEISS